MAFLEIVAKQFTSLILMSKRLFAQRQYLSHCLIIFKIKVEST
jgi:hypothetical protein